MRLAKGVKQRGPAKELGLVLSPGVVFKGFRHGLRLLLPAEGDFGAVRDDLAGKLEASGEFFHGAKVLLDQSLRLLLPEEVEVVRTLLEQHGVEMIEPEISQDKSAPDQGEQTLTVRAPVRSGQRVAASGNILILGDVHPGAEILAGLDVIVMGVARGTIAAGLVSGREARVVAFQLRPSLLRLGDVVARFSENESVWGAEEARVQGEGIIVEPFRGWQRAKTRAARKN
ncbi:MAG: septum site-determining protein MinC [Bacteroidota bacterium]